MKKKPINLTLFIAKYLLKKMLIALSSKIDLYISELLKIRNGWKQLWVIFILHNKLLKIPIHFLLLVSLSKDFNINIDLVDGIGN